MTIDEAIKRIKEKMACDYNISGCDTCNISSCEDRDIVIQLAEWLEELKILKLLKNCSFMTIGKTVEQFEQEIRNKAIDDFVEHITLPITTEEQISEIVEQLKKEN